MKLSRTSQEPKVSRIGSMATSKETAIVVRFANSNPDLPLYLVSPEATSGLGLKLIIRSQLPEESASCRLRLIFSGRVVADAVPLTQSLNLSSSRSSAAQRPGGKVKGKAPAHNVDDAEGERSVTYIHCSMGDDLTEEELDSERSAAEAADDRLQQTFDRQTASGPDPIGQTGGGIAQSSTIPRPQGFERLASAGFTQEDIMTLRQTFLARLSHTHTPETMPRGAALLALEEGWLDETTPAMSSDGANGVGGGYVDDEEQSALDDLFYGNLMGFFFPLFAVVLGFREEGIWTRRRQIAVLTGVIINVVFGFAKWST